MDILEQFLYSISYKFPKGYPDLKDKNDLAILENEFAKLDINLNEPNPPHHQDTQQDESIIDDRDINKVTE